MHKRGDYSLFSLILGENIVKKIILIIIMIISITIMITIIIVIIILKSLKKQRIFYRTYELVWFVI